MIGKQKIGNEHQESVLDNSLTLTSNHEPTVVVNWVALFSLLYNIVPTLHTLCLAARLWIRL